MLINVSNAWIISSNTGKYLDFILKENRIILSNLEVFKTIFSKLNWTNICMYSCKYL